jgi:hypothetical protein
MLWRDGDILHFRYKAVCLDLLAEQTVIIIGLYPHDYELLRADVTWFEIEQLFLLDYIEYLIESAIDEHLARDTSLHRAHLNMGRSSVVDVTYRHYTDDEFAKMLGELSA